MATDELAFAVFSCHDNFFSGRFASHRLPLAAGMARFWDVGTKSAAGKKESRKAGKSATKMSQTRIFQTAKEMRRSKAQGDKRTAARLVFISLSFFFFSPPVFLRRSFCRLHSHGTRCGDQQPKQERGRKQERCSWEGTRYDDRKGEVTRIDTFSQLPCLSVICQHPLQLLFEIVSLSLALLLVCPSCYRLLYFPSPILRVSHSFHANNASYRNTSQPAEESKACSKPWSWS